MPHIRQRLKLPRGSQGIYVAGWMCHTQEEENTKHSSNTSSQQKTKTSSFRMALLLETTLGDLVIDLDVEGSPELCKNVLKLAKARYYTSTLVYNVQVNRFCQLGDPQGDGSGGACIYGLISTLLNDGELRNERVLLSNKRFLNSSEGRPLTPEECREKGRVVATEMKGILNTIGSQLLITTCEGKDVALDGYRANENGDGRQVFRSVGIVREDDNNILDQIAAAYCDADGRPYADIRIIRALVIDDPFDDPPGMKELLQAREVEIDREDRLTKSPEYERPREEKLETRIQADQVDLVAGEEDPEKLRQQEEELLKRDDKSRAVVLEMLGDLPDAEMTAPENVLFVCKLNPVTEDDDLELIFSRFDEKVKAEIIRDNDTGASLQYAFVEFSTKEQAAEAYFKMNNALVDDRRIKVDFSQSVAKVWNKFSQRMRNPAGQRSNQHMPKDPFSSERSRNPIGRGMTGQGRGRGESINSGRRGRDRGRNPPFDRPGHGRGEGPGPRHGRNDNESRHRDHHFNARPAEIFDDFGRRLPPQQAHSDRGENHSRGDSRNGEDGISDSGHRYYDDRRSRRSPERERRTHRRDRKHRKRSHKEDPRTRDVSSEDDRSKGSGRRRDRKQDERRHQERRGRSRSTSSDDGSDDRNRKRDRKKSRKGDSKRRRHNDDRHLHQKRTSDKSRKKHHRRDDSR